MKKDPNTCYCDFDNWQPINGYKHTPVCPLNKLEREVACSINEAVENCNATWFLCLVHLPEEYRKSVLKTREALLTGSDLSPSQVAC
jgi:hypothetical protein